MTNRIIILIIFSFIHLGNMDGQTPSKSNQYRNMQDLRSQISKIINGKDATIGVALIVEGKDSLTINNKFRYPTQSVYKFHLALAVLNYLEKNNLSLDHQLYIKKSDLLPDTYSPLRDDYPNGNISLSVGDILRYTVSKSDNNGCDILFRFVGGTAVVDKYIRSLGMTDFAIAATEEEMHGPWEVQYTNWSTPYTAALVLEKFRTGKILSDASYNFLWKTMIETSTGTNKIKALLPDNVLVAHKTGSSFRNATGLNAAENDIAIIQLSDGKYYSLAIFVADSMEDSKTNCKIIADISKVIYDYLISEPKQ